jgi:RNase P subunit RPR2
MGKIKKLKMLNEGEIKISRLFCRFCKDWTNQVCISDTNYYVNTACLRCGSIHHFHGRVYANIKFLTINIDFNKLNDGERITKSSG